MLVFRDLPAGAFAVSLLLVVGANAARGVTPPSPVTTNPTDYHHISKNNKLIGRDVTSCLRIALPSQPLQTKKKNDGKQSLAFGDSALEILCRAIAEAWRRHRREKSLRPKKRDPEIEKANDADRVNKLVVNFERKSAVGLTRRTIEADVLARLLTVQNLLPKEIFGGLVLKNLEVDGALVLDNATIYFPIEFQDAFLNKGMSGKEANIKKSYKIMGGKIKGPVDFRGSVFDGKIVFHGVTFSQSKIVFVNSRFNLGAVFSEINVIDPSMDFFIEQVKLEGGLLLRGNGSVNLRNDVRIIDSRIDHLYISGLVSDGIFYVLNNEFDSLTARSNWFFGDTVIQSNTVHRDLQVLFDVFAVPPWEPSQPDGGSLTISANAVGGGMYFQPKELGDTISRLDFSYNRLESYSEIWLPTGWQGQLDLTSTSAKSMLRLQRSVAYRTIDDGKPKSIRPAHWGYARRALTVTEQVLKTCPQIKLKALKNQKETLIVNLTAVNVDTLAWNFPLDCFHKWEGSGLRYRYWGDTDLKKWNQDSDEIKGEEDFRNWFWIWRHTLANPDTDALNFMAKYLQERGKFTDSRTVLRQAKRLNYAWNPDEKLQWNLLSGVAWFLLMPVGFGANPEWALVEITVIWLFMALVYGIYSCCKKPKWLKREQCTGTDKEKGLSRKPGFMQFDSEAAPKNFNLLQYSLDATLPVVNLHAYEKYYPEHGVVRFASFVQHIVGWILITVFIATAAIL